MSWNPETKIVVAPLNTNIGGDIGRDRGSDFMDYQIRIKLNH